MPLSEHEQRVLEDIERRLHEEDPRFARQVTRSPRLSDASRLKLGALLFFAGLGVLILFFVSRALAAGVIAFGAMVTGIVLATGALTAMAGRERRGNRRFARVFEDWEGRIRRRNRRS